MYCPIVLCAFVITACITVRPRPQARALLGFGGELPVAAKLHLLDWLKSFLEEDPNLCPRCGQGQMRMVREFGPVIGWRAVVARLLGMPTRAQPAAT